jgi:hypothetical protein
MVNIVETITLLKNFSTLVARELCKNINLMGLLHMESLALLNMVIMVLIGARLKIDQYKSEHPFTEESIE